MSMLAYNGVLRSPQAPGYEHKSKIPVAERPGFTKREKEQKGADPIAAV